MTTLGELYREAGIKCREAGTKLDAEPCGAIHEWVIQNVKFRPGTEFFIVQGIASAMADLDAQDEGFENQLDRAAHLMKQSEAYKRHQANRLRGVTP